MTRGRLVRGCRPRKRPSWSGSDGLDALWGDGGRGFWNTVELSGDRSQWSGPAFRSQVTGVRARPSQRRRGCNPSWKPASAISASHPF